MVPTPSEELVHKLCEKSFFGLWSYASPQGKKGRELCDVLVVCDPHVIIFSVKEVVVSQSGSDLTDWERWCREAIEKSADQIYGAERWLSTQQFVTRRDGSRGLALPPTDRRRVHRIAVALGSEGRVPIAGPGRRRGWIHVLEETALAVLMQELDTISDFTAYLQEKEDAFAVSLMMYEQEADVLALYIQHDRKFPRGLHVVMLEGGFWERIASSDWYMAKKRADEASAVFDEIIARFSDAMVRDVLEPPYDLSRSEQMLRILARETRVCRRVLGRHFWNFMTQAASLPTGLSRLVMAPSGVLYVFLAMPRRIAREDRQAELQVRTLIARGLNPDCKCAVGIATEQIDGDEGVSLDGAMIDDWTPEHQEEFEKAYAELGYFKNMQLTRFTETEYPSKGALA